MPVGRERIRYDPVPTASAADVDNIVTKTTHRQTLVGAEMARLDDDGGRRPLVIVASVLIVARLVDAAGCGARQIQQQPLRAYARTLRSPVCTASSRLK